MGTLPFLTPVLLLQFALAHGAGTRLAACAPAGPHFDARSSAPGNQGAHPRHGYHSPSWDLAADGLGVCCQVAVARKGRCSASTGGYPRGLSCWQDASRDNDGQRIYSAQGTTTSSICFLSPWSQLILASVAALPPAPPASAGSEEPVLTSTHTHTYLVTSTMVLPEHGRHILRKRLRLTEHGARQGESTDHLYEMVVESNTLVDKHGMHHPLVAENDMRRYPFYFSRSASGAVRNVMYHRSESHQVLGSKRFLASAHHQMVNASGTDWVGRETDGVGTARARYQRRGGSGLLRPHHVFRKAQVYERSAQVSKGFVYESNITSIRRRDARVPHLIRQSTLLMPDHEKLAAMGRKFQFTGGSGRPKDFKPPPPELAPMDSLPKQPSLVEWELLESTAQHTRHRRLSVDSLLQMGFASGPLTHPTGNGPAYADVQQAMRVKATKQHSHLCHTADLQSLLAASEEDLADWSKRLGRIKVLKRRNKECNGALRTLFANQLLSVHCQGDGAADCGGLLSAFVALARDAEEQEVLAAFLGNTTAAHVPREALITLATTIKPEAALLRALVGLLQPFQVNATDYDRWSFVRVLLPASGVVYHLNHGHGRRPRGAPRRALPEDVALAAHFITHLVVSALHTGLVRDRDFDAVHSRARARAETLFDERVTTHEREWLVADRAQVHARHGLPPSLAARVSPPDNANPTPAPAGVRPAPHTGEVCGGASLGDQDGELRHAFEHRDGRAEGRAFNA